jgi:hypothetical protein
LTKQIEGIYPSLKEEQQSKEREREREREEEEKIFQKIKN